ncbi:MAG: RNA ligase family protein, partial [Dehalococcoidia bacterium]
IDEDGALEFASHHQQIFPGAAGQFEPAVQHVIAHYEALRELAPVCLYGEYLAKPRQNTIAYARIPRGYIVLFDMAIGGVLRDYDAALGQVAERLECDVVRTIHRGPVTMDDLRGMLTEKPMLGGDMLEGIVVKNYGQNILLGGQVWPVFCKLVNEQFKEKHAANPDWKSGKNREQEYYDTFCTEARWRKAVQHMRERGELQDAPQDIGPLMKEIHADLLDEEAEDIKEWLYREHVKDVVRAAQRGFADWYKAQLVERVQ